MDLRTSSVSRNLAKGLLAGALGGLVGAGAKIVGELIYPPRTLGQVPPPVILAERMAGHPLSPLQQNISMQAIHFVFGATTGAFYGAVAEFAPIVTVGYGSAFGFVMQFFTHESFVPLAGLDVPPWRQPLREHASEFFTHILFGVATEVTRRAVRKRL